MKITLSGSAGTGKGTIAKRLVTKYGLTYYDVGNLRRDEALKRNMSLAEYNDWSEHNNQGDTFFDEKQKEIGRVEDNFIFVGRLSWYFIPDAIKILLTVSDEEAARRIFAHSQSEGRVGEHFLDVDEARESVRTRNASDLTRYGALYGIHSYDPAQFSLVIDTTSLSEDEVFAKIIAYIDSQSS